MKIKPETLLTPRERYEQALLELALYEMDMQEVHEAEAALADQENPETAEIEAHYQQSRAKISALIAGQTRKNSRKAAFKRTAPRVLRLAAGILLTLYLGATVALAVSSSIRVYVAEFFIKVGEETTEVGFQRNESRFADVPHRWTGFYFPTYIPDGFELYQIGPFSSSSMAVYKRGDTELLTIYEMDWTMSMTFDNGETEISPVKLNGMDALLVWNPAKQSATITWAYGDRSFWLELTGTTDEVYQIAQSMIRIR